MSTTLSSAPLDEFLVRWFFPFLRLGRIRHVRTEGAAFTRLLTQLGKEVSHEAWGDPPSVLALATPLEIE